MSYSLNGVLRNKYQILSEDRERLLCRWRRPGDDGIRESVLIVLPAADRPSRSSLDRLTHEHGLKDELDRAWAAPSEATGRIDEFPLGAQDAADRLIIPERLYGLSIATLHNSRSRPAIGYWKCPLSSLRW
jgi:hypothetical protein